MAKMALAVLVNVLFLLPVHQLSSQEKPLAGASDKIADTIAAQWAFKAMNLPGKHKDEVIDLAVAAQEAKGTTEAQMARYLAMANSKVKPEQALGFEFIFNTRLTAELARLEAAVERLEGQRELANKEHFDLQLQVEILRGKLIVEQEVLR